MDLPLIISKSISRLLRPLVKILINQGVSAGEFIEVVKRTYVQVAEEDFQMPGRKQSTSRVSVLTGMSRAEVARYRKALKTLEPAQANLSNRAGKVLKAWSTQPEYLSVHGGSLDLDVEGPAPSFADLAKRYSGGIPTRAVLDELLRIGAAKAVGDKVRLVQTELKPSPELSEDLEYLGEACSDLITAFQRNMNPDEDNILNLSVVYDNIPANYTSEFRELSEQLSIEMLQRVDQWLREHDRDDNPDIEGEGQVRLGVGLYQIAS